MAVPTGTRVFRIGLLHAGANLTATALFVVGFLLRRGHLDDAGVPLPLIGLSVLAVLVLGAGGFLGGELAYRVPRSPMRTRRPRDTARPIGPRRRADAFHPLETTSERRALWT